jgi:hypothetical protein
MHIYLNMLKTHGLQRLYIDICKCLNMRNITYHINMCIKLCELSNLQFTFNLHEELILGRRIS